MRKKLKEKEERLRENQIRLEEKYGLKYSNILEEDAKQILQELEVEAEKISNEYHKIWHDIGPSAQLHPDLAMWDNPDLEYIMKKKREIFEEIEYVKRNVIGKYNLETIKKAFENAKKIQMGEKTYFELLLEQRMEGPNNSGSSYEVESLEELYENLLKQEWEETTHPDVIQGCRVFRTYLKGLKGIVDLNYLPNDVELYAIDPKQTRKIGIAAANIKKCPTHVTYLIIGKENINGKDEDVVFTFHPGEPIRPSQVETLDIPDGTKLTKEQAKILGFDMVKYLSKDMVKEYRKKSKLQQAKMKKKDINGQDIGKASYSATVDECEKAQRELEGIIKEKEHISIAN